MKENDKNNHIWNQQREYISTRWSQLYELEKEWGKEAIKYLLLINSGGAVATLSFLGSSEIVRSLLFPKLSLLLFLVGIVSAGVIVAYAYETMSRLYNGWVKDVDSHYKDEISYKVLTKRDNDRVPSGKADRILGYISFGCFISGCGLGVISLL